MDSISRSIPICIAMLDRHASGRPLGYSWQRNTPARSSRRAVPPSRCGSPPAARPTGTMGDYHMTYGDSAKATASRLAGETRKAAYAERHPSLSRDGEAEFFDAYAPEACPRCGSLRFKRDGHDRNGVQRYRCLDCRRTFTPATGTISGTRHLPVSEWAMFLPKILGSESGAACTCDHQRSSETSSGTAPCSRIGYGSTRHTGRSTRKTAGAMLTAAR